MCRGIVGLQAQGLLKAGLRLGQAALLLEDYAQVIVRRGIDWLQPEQLLKAGLGFGQPPLRA